MNIAVENGNAAASGEDSTGNTRKRGGKNLEICEKNDETPRPKKRRITRRKYREMGERIHLLTNNDDENIGISSIPIEILLEIISYLDCRDLYTLRGVSKFFERLVLEPSVWTVYEVSNTEPSTSEVIDELKRMPHLRRIRIEARNDCDDILRQLSCSNKKLQKLNILNCTGTSGNLYLRPAYLIRILERCTRLHTIGIRGSRFRGFKFYRLLGDMGHRLRFISVSATCMQFRTFVQHAIKLDDNERNAICSMSTRGARRWSLLRYYTVEKSDRTRTGLVSYFNQNMFHVHLRTINESKTRINANSLSPVTTMYT